MKVSFNNLRKNDYNNIGFYKNIYQIFHQIRIFEEKYSYNDDSIKLINPNQYNSEEKCQKDLCKLNKKSTRSKIKFIGILKDVKNLKLDDLNLDGIFINNHILLKEIKFQKKINYFSTTLNHSYSDNKLDDKNFPDECDKMYIDINKEDVDIYNYSVNSDDDLDDKKSIKRIELDLIDKSFKNINVTNLYLDLSHPHYQIKNIYIPKTVKNLFLSFKNEYINNDFSFPPDLEILFLIGEELIEFPKNLSFPDSLKHIYLRVSSIKNLPKLPKKIKSLDIEGIINNKSEYKELLELNCKMIPNNKLIELKLINIDVRNLSALTISRTKYLSFENSHCDLPELSEGLKYLRIDNNILYGDNIPESLKILIIKSNKFMPEYNFSNFSKFKILEDNIILEK